MLAGMSQDTTLQETFKCYSQNSSKKTVKKSDLIQYHGGHKISVKTYATDLKLSLKL